MTIKKISSGYEIHFRGNDSSSREPKKAFPAKAKCERFPRYTIAQLETQADVKPWLEKPKDMRLFSKLVEPRTTYIRKPFHYEWRQHLDLTKGTRS